MKKYLSVIFALIMVLTVVPVIGLSAFAEGDDIATNTEETTTEAPGAGDETEAPGEGTETPDPETCVHVEGEWVVTVEPTCTTDGEKTVKCTLCDETLKTETIPAAHKYGEWRVVREASCTAKGERTRTCECGEMEIEIIEMTEHSYGEWVVTKPSTEFEEGEETSTCSVCGATKTQAIPMLGQIEGDANLDGKLGAIDARYILQYVVGSREFDSLQLIVADVDNNGRITAVDARRVLQMATGII